MKPSRLLPLLFILFAVNFTHAQSFELMTGTKRLFFDLKIIKIFDAHKNLSLLHRTRANAEYDIQNNDIFAGTYLNYSFKPGFGPTLVGRIATGGSGFDFGVHYFKATPKFFAYILPAVQIKDEFLFTALSFLRYSPGIKNDWRLHSSLELFTAFNDGGHLKSLQRIRLGVGKKGYNFGLALDFVEKGGSLENVDTNPGVFVERRF
ncbi:MAG: hypothetical protein IPJ40_07685 [Saprospirales bacterium]|nr:hypothetical protein [Saprospirales bacterium]